MLAAINFNITLSRNGYVNRKGERQIVIELYQSGTGERRVLNTHLHVKNEDFSDGMVQPSCDNYDIYNRMLRRITRKLLELEDELLEGGQICTPCRLLGAYQNNQTRSASISEWVASVILPSGRKKSTKMGYNTLTQCLDEFRPDLRIKELSYDVIIRWWDWMREVKGYKHNTIIGRLKSLRCLMTEAVKRDVISVDEDPFKRITIPEMRPLKGHLTTKEVGKLERVQLLDSRLSHIRDAFLFCVYTGLRWADFRGLSSSSLQGRTLVVDQLKTGHVVQIPIDTIFHGKAKDIITRYGTLECLCNIGCNSHANTLLREVGRQAKVGKHLHWHIARHTCGTLLNQHGLAMQEIQYLLGHRKQETTTRHYAETTFVQVLRSCKRAFKY